MRKAFAVSITVAAALVLAVGTHAQFKGVGKYAAAIIENNGEIVVGIETNPTCAGDCSAQGYSFAAEKSKIQVKPSKKDGDGGFTIQLNAKFIDCPGEEGNDSGKAGACGPKGSPVINHVLELRANAFGIASPVGVLYDIEKGKAAFQSTGKNKTPAGGAGALVTILFKQPLAIDGARLHVPGSDVLNGTTGCGVAPLPAVNTCIDGDVYGLAGIRVGEDQSLICTSAVDCSGAGFICSGGTCIPEPCTMDADCDQDGDGIGGTSQCDCGAGTCCDPLQNPACPAIC